MGVPEKGKFHQNCYFGLFENVGYLKNSGLTGGTCFILKMMGLPMDFGVLGFSFSDEPTQLGTGP